MNSIEEKVIQRTAQFRDEVELLRFSPDLVVYNPLRYAWDLHQHYLRRYVNKQVDTLFLGMNPGPFGMAQNGVPFGEIDAVRDFLQLDGEVGKPPFEHPARPILGMKTTRSEVSGRRVWSLFKERYGSAKRCFSELTVINYCPLVFMDRGPRGKNITPDKLPKSERLALESVCDSYLTDIVHLVEPSNLIGVGTYAQKKLLTLFPAQKGRIVDSILHPSPANPQANKHWNEKVTEKLLSLGIWS